jgi:hypothetical protein
MLCAQMCVVVSLSLLRASEEASWLKQKQQQSKVETIVLALAAALAF